VQPEGEGREPGRGILRRAPGEQSVRDRLGALLRRKTGERAQLLGSAAFAVDRPRLRPPQPAGGLLGGEAERRLDPPRQGILHQAGNGFRRTLVGGDAAAERREELRIARVGRQRGPPEGPSVPRVSAI